VYPSLGTKWDQAQINPKKLLRARSAYERMFHVEHISYLANSRTSNQQVLPRKRRDAMCSTRNSPDVYRHSFKQRPNMLTPLPGCQTKSTSRYRDQSPTEDLPICKEGYRRKLAPPGRSPHPPEKIDARFRPSANSEPCSAQDRSLRSTWNIKITNFRNSIATKLLFGMFQVEHIFETDSPC